MIDEIIEERFKPPNKYESQLFWPCDKCGAECYEQDVVCPCCGKEINHEIEEGLDPDE